ncbi:MAG: hypothetical protein U1E65_15250 [Myxococcota bacterium]
MSDTTQSLPALADEIRASVSTATAITAEQYMTWSGRLRGLPEGEIGSTCAAICQLATWQSEHGKAPLAEQLFDLAMSASAEMAKETASFQAQEAALGSSARRQLLGGSEKVRAPKVGEAAPAGSIQAGGLSPRRA